MRITGDWLTSVDTQAVLGLLTEAGYQAYAVGGCARNALLGVPVADVDIATSAVPEEVVRLSEAAGLKAVPTGLEHGTITVVSNGEPHEVTTFRKDIDTDGRRAVIAYSDNIKDDAIRRDFTVNALYVEAMARCMTLLVGCRTLKQGASDLSKMPPRGSKRITCEYCGFSVLRRGMVIQRQASMRKVWQPVQRMLMEFNRCQKNALVLK